MAALTIAKNGQVRLQDDVLQHLGVHAGDELEVELLPGHSATLRAPRRGGTLQNFAGCLADKIHTTASLEQLDRAAEEGWAGFVD